MGYSAGAHLVALLGVTDRNDGLEGPDATADSPGTRLQCVVAGGKLMRLSLRCRPTCGRLAYWLRRQPSGKAAGLRAVLRLSIS